MTGVLNAVQVVPAARNCLRTAVRTVAVEAAQGWPERARALASAAWQKVYAGGAGPARAERGALLRLLRQHLQDGLLRIGRSWFRQTHGIPQASCQGAPSKQAKFGSHVHPSNS